MLHGMQPNFHSLSLSLFQHYRVTHSSAPQAAEEWVVPRSPRGPRPPPRPGESVYSGSSGRDGSCSVSHRLTHTHTSYKIVTVMTANSNYRPKRLKVEPLNFTVHHPTAGFVNFLKLAFTWLISEWRASKLVQPMWALAQWAIASRKLQSTNGAASQKKKKNQKFFFKKTKKFRRASFSIPVLSSLSSR